MSGVILCVGALSLDTIFRLESLPAGPGKVLPGEALQIVQGMATAQAATIVTLGGKARLWAACGDDATGARMAGELQALGIDVSALRRVAGAVSGFSSILMDRQGERIIVPFYDPALRQDPVSAPDMKGVAAVSVDVRWPGAAALALQAARAAGVPAILDLEIGPLETLEPLLASATHIVASEAGARHVTGLEAAAARDALARRTGAEVVVTCSEQGLFWSGGHMPAFPVETVDSLAAGDVFHGAFALALTEGRNLAAALRFAGAAAAIKCTRFGGRLGVPQRHEVETLLARA